MNKVNAEVTDTIDAPPSAVWPILEDFGNITRWVPGIDQVDIIGEGIGMIRRLHIDGLAEPIDEQLSMMNAEAFTFSYRIPKGLPFPLKNYSATAMLKALDEEQCQVIWRSDCEADGISIEDATAMLEGTYAQLIGWLKGYFNARNKSA